MGDECRPYTHYYPSLTIWAVNMLTKEQNERLTRVGPGTPLGTLLRRYWWPVAGVSELIDRPPNPSVSWARTLCSTRIARGGMACSASVVRIAVWT